MNKNELIKEMSDRLSIPQSKSQLYINTCLDIIKHELKKGENVMFQNFGSFSPWGQTERLGRNPQNGEPHMIRPRVSVKFRPGKSFLSKLNEKGI